MVRHPWYFLFYPLLLPCWYYPTSRLMISKLLPPNSSSLNSRLMPSCSLFYIFTWMANRLLRHTYPKLTSYLPSTIFQAALFILIEVDPSFLLVRPKSWGYSWLSSRISKENHPKWSGIQLLLSATAITWATIIPHKDYCNKSPCFYSGSLIL